MSFSLHASPEALAPLCNSIVDNPLIIHRLHTPQPSTYQTSSLPHYGLRTVPIWILSIIKCGAWCKSKSTRHQSMM